MSGYTNFATVRYYFEARVLTGYKACIFLLRLVLALVLASIPFPGEIGDVILQFVHVS